MKLYELTAMFAFDDPLDEAFPSLRAAKGRASELIRNAKDESGLCSVEIESVKLYPQSLKQTALACLNRTHYKIQGLSKQEFYWSASDRG